MAIRKTDDIWIGHKDWQVYLAACACALENNEEISIRACGHPKVVQSRVVDLLVGIGAKLIDKTVVNQRGTMGKNDIFPVTVVRLRGGNREPKALSSTTTNNKT